MDLPDLVNSTSLGKCSTCQKPAKQRCAACKEASYCSQEHQSKNWDTHKGKCCPYIIERNDKVGRYIVAARKIEAGEIIMEDPAAAVGPKQDSLPQCLTCYSWADGSYFCPRCKWPMCDDECANDDAHKVECGIFSAAGVHPQIEDWEAVCPMYDAITPLRILMVKEKNPTKWAEVKVMETHAKERRKEEAWKTNDMNAINVLRGQCKLKQFSEDEIHDACGVFEVNAFAAPGAYYDAGALYPNGGIFSHSCVNNTHRSICKDFRIVFRASVPIEKGQEILTSYTSSMSTTKERRRFLRNSKYFECDCARCRDPTELGANTSAFKCSNCPSGWIYSSNPLDDAAEWKCNSCTYSAPADSIQKVLDLLQAKSDATDDNDIIGIEKLVKEYKGILHPHHSLLIRLKYTLSQLYGHLPGYVLTELPDILLERKITICEEVLDAAQYIEPGLTRLRGMTLYELHAAIIILAQRQLDNYEIGPDEFRESAKRALGHLREAVRILEFDDSNTQQGLVGQAARDSLQQLEIFEEQLNVDN